MSSVRAAFSGALLDRARRLWAPGDGASLPSQPVFGCSRSPSGVRAGRSSHARNLSLLRGLSLEDGAPFGLVGILKAVGHEDEVVAKGGLNRPLDLPDGNGVVEDHGVELRHPSGKAVWDFGAPFASGQAGGRVGGQARSPTPEQACGRTFSRARRRRGIRPAWRSGKS